MLHTIKDLPHDLKIEMNFLSCLILQQDLIAQTKLKPKDFYDTKNGDLFKSMKKMYKEGIDVEIATLISKGVDPQYVMDIAMTALSVSGFQTYEGIIRSKSLYRSVITASNRLVSMAFDELDWADIYGLMNKMSNETTGDEDDGISHIEAASNYIENIGHQTSNVCSYGYNNLDKILGGLKKGQLIIIGAGTGVGKTLFSINIIEQIIKQKKKVALFALEMTEHEVMERMIAKWSGIPTHKLDSEKTDVAHVTKSVTDNISEEQVFMIYRRTSDLHRILGYIRKLHMQQGLDVVFVDYLQLVRVSGLGRMSKNDMIGEITRDLKCIAQELDITVILLSQLNRSGTRGDDKPALHNLRDSGNIEQDANVVLLLYREDDSNYYKDKFEVIIAKNRNGKTGFIEMGLNYGLMSISDIKQPTN